MIISQKIRIYPNKTMQLQFKDFFNYSRYSYNVSLNIWNEMYINGNKPNERKVRDEYKRKLKPEWDNFPPNIFDNTCKNMAYGWKRFFTSNSGKPKFKNKRKAKSSFTINRKAESTIRIINNRLFLPKFKYGVKMSESIRFNGDIKICTITKRANQYFASFCIDTDDSMYHSNQNLPTVGIDANIGHFDISEENHRFNSPLKNLIPLYKKISLYQKILSRKVNNSNKYNKVKIKLQNIYLKIQNIQDDWLHKFTSYVIKNYHTICIEDLNVKGMLSNRKISKSISRSLFYRFKVQLQYKSILYGNTLIIADRWFPSTQICSCC
ncbi:IS607 family transposase [Listeria phage LPJP1]|nr:IS607 family transposase [Listeria phage LPJP1]